MSEDKLYKIDEKRIPIPSKRGNSGKTDFLKSLSVGQSFVVTEDDGKVNNGNWNLLAKRANMTVTVRDIGNGQYRVWLVEKDGVKIDEQK